MKEFNKFYNTLTYKYQAFHENGQLYLEYDTIYGILEGRFLSWYENGQLKEEANYKDGELDGLFKNWYENDSYIKASTKAKYSAEYVWFVITTYVRGYDAKFQGGSYKPSDPKKNLKQVITKPETVEITKEDIEKWSLSDETIDKYKKRYAEEWRMKLDEVVKRMMEKI